MGSKNPKVNFAYSYIYDQTFASLSGNKYFEGTKKEAMSYMKALEKEFSYFSGKVLAGISKASGLMWQKPYIDVYISKYAPSSFSVPLTIRMYKNAKVGNSILIHELVHNMVFQNEKRIRYAKLFKDFSSEGTMTKYHIIEGAILYLLNKEIFSDGLAGFFEYDNWASPKAGEAYMHAISIVLERGAERIIKSYISKD
ncbi:MAG: hypothetical protein ACP5MZ_03360 [Candidatus Micrarchaeia archaeon]